jgi:cell wall-associated NlpC family hydrolase
MHQWRTIGIRLAVVALLGLLATGCAQRPVVPASGAAPAWDRAVETRPRPEHELRRRLVSHTERMLGRPYRYGGESPREGFDCSGLVYFSHRQLGIEVPRTSSAQRRRSRAVPLQALRPGDLVFFNLTGAKAGHVGIYVGDGRFIHAPSSGKRVSTSSLDNPYWRRHLAGAGSFL